MLAGRGLPFPSRVLAQVSRSPFVLASFSFRLLVLALPHLLLRRPDSSSVNPHDVAKAAEADAEKIATEEAAKGAAEDAAKVPAGGTGKATTNEAGKAAAKEEVVDDQPASSATSGSSRYLKVGDDMFVHLPGTAGPRAPA